MKLKITFKVQSLSDIITNSSSEVFLRIDSKDEKTHNEIYKVMQELFPGNDYEMSPGVWEYTEDGEYSISLEVPYGSYGNGSAMRVSPVGFYAHNAKECLELAKNSALCSHNDPEGVKGAQAIALAIYRAKHDSITKNQIWYVLDNYYPEYTEKTLDEIRPGYHFDSTCQGSVPIALLAFLESEDYEDCLKLAISMGGDSDTIAAMAGSIAYAYYEKMPQIIFDQVWDVLPEEMIDIIETFDDVCE